LLLHDGFFFSLPAAAAAAAAETAHASQLLPLHAGLRAVAAFGGLSKFEQFKELKSGCEIAVATPGRMMDLIRMKACTTQRVTYLVLDEADRMFDMGFEQQVRTRVDHV
jgi:superfamily II DNA/RNA helicase